MPSCFSSSSQCRSSKRSRPAAAAAARQYIALREMSGTARVDGDVVIAEVTDTQELAILSVLGLAPVEVTGRAESRSTRAVNGVEVAGGGGR